MFDTIVFRQYEPPYQMLNIIEHNCNTVMNGVRKSWRIYEQHDSYLETNGFASNSHHNKIKIKINRIERWVEFEFSIPKYFKGHNLYEIRANSQLLFDQIPFAFGLLEKVILKFYKDEFQEVKINFDTIEIRRLDICYNQIFDSSSSAQCYLDTLIVRNKITRSDSKKSTYEGESVNHVTQAHSFKIYHKGAEFRKHDFNKLDLDLSKKRELAELADRTLRYEMTFRKISFDYAFYAEVIPKICRAPFDSVYKYKLEKNDFLELFRRSCTFQQANDLYKCYKSKSRSHRHFLNPSEELKNGINPYFNSIADQTGIDVPFELIVPFLISKFCQRFNEEQLIRLPDHWEEKLIRSGSKSSGLKMAIIEMIGGKSWREATSSLNKVTRSRWKSALKKAGLNDQFTSENIYVSQVLEYSSKDVIPCLFYN